MAVIQTCSVSIERGYVRFTPARGLRWEIPVASCSAVLVGWLKAHDGFGFFRVRSANGDSMVFAKATSEEWEKAHGSTVVGGLTR